MMLPLLLVTARKVNVETSSTNSYCTQVSEEKISGCSVWLASSLPDWSHLNNMGTVQPVLLLSRQENLDSYC